MPSLLTRIGNLFPGFRATPTPAPVPVVRTPEERLAIVKRTQEQLDATPRRSRPATEERIPQNYAGGIAGKVWFLPYNDSATHDSPEIRSAMRLMPRNPYVKAAWWTQILSVASQDWQIQPSEPGNSESEEQAKAFAAMLDDYTAGGRPGIVQSVCTPLGPDGFTVAEKVWGYAERGRLEGRIVLNALKDKDPDFLHVKGDQYGNVTHLASTRRAGDEFPIGDFVFVRYLPIFNEPLGMAAFRASYGEYWMLDTVEKLRAIHVEKRMAGMLVGEYENDDDKGTLETALAKAKTATWISIPAGCKVTAIALSTAAEPDYKSFVESKQTGIVTGISGAALQILQGTIPNARGDTKVQKSTSDLFPWWLTMLVQEAVSSQIARDFIDFNYPYPAGGGYPRITLGAVSNAEILEMLQVIEGEQRVGLKLSKKAVARALSVQLADPNDTEDVLAPAQPTAPPVGALGGVPGGSQPFAFAEFGERLEYTAFGWQPARSRTGTTKAVGTGENAGSTLYGADAEAALAGGDGGAKQDSRDDGELKRLADQVKNGDIDSAVEVHRRAQVYADAALAGERKPIDADTARATWAQASAGIAPQHAEAIGTHLNELASGASNDPSTLRKVFGGLVGAIKAAGSLGVRAVAAFAHGIQKQLGPYSWWAASLAVSAAIMAAPAAAAGLGLIGGWMALAATPTAAASVIGVRKGFDKLATRSAVKNWGLQAGETFAEGAEDEFEQFADGRGFTGVVRDRLGREYHYVDGKRVAQDDADGTSKAEQNASGGFAALEKGPDVKAREIGEAQSNRHKFEIDALTTGKATPDEVRAMAAGTEAGALRAVNSQVSRRVGALRADVARTYGPESLSSPEWAAVESHIESAHGRLRQAVSDSAVEVRAAADDYRKTGAIRKATREWLDENRNRAAAAGSSLVNGLPALFAAFKAKHGKAPAQHGERFGERITAAEVADALVHRFGWQPDATDATPASHLFAAMLQAKAAGDGDLLDSLAELASDPEGLAELIADIEDGTYGTTKMGEGDFEVFAWRADPTKRSKTRITSDTGQHAYGSQATRIMASQGRSERNEPEPELPQVKAKRLAAEREPARQAAREAFSQALKSPTSLKPEEIDGLATHLHTLTRDEARLQLKALGAKAGGKLKGDIVNGLVDHVRKSNNSPNSTSTTVDKEQGKPDTTGVGSQVAAPKPEGGKVEVKELPKLLAKSDSQASYGEKVREQALGSLDKHLSSLPPERAESAAAEASFLRGISSARFWLDNQVLKGESGGKRILDVASSLMIPPSPIEVGRDLSAEEKVIGWPAHHRASESLREAVSRAVSSGRRVDSQVLLRYLTGSGMVEAKTTFPLSKLDETLEKTAGVPKGSFGGQISPELIPKYADSLRKVLPRWAGITEGQA